MENLIFYLLSLFGVVLHIYVKWIDSRTKKEKINMLQHVLFGIASYLLVVVLIISWEYLPAGILDFTGPLNPFLAFLIGYNADSILKNITKFTGKFQLNG